MEYSQVIGVVLDVSLRHDPGGKRIIDVVKQQMAKYLLRIVDGEDLFYLYDPARPDAVTPVEHIGKITSSIGNYETDGWVFNIGFALKQTYYVVVAEDEDLDKRLIVVTDRLQAVDQIEKIVRLRQRDQTNCRLIVAGIGPRYDKAALEGIDGLTFIHMDQAESLCELLYRGDKTDEEGL
jgi:hypothetical protein